MLEQALVLILLRTLLLSVQSADRFVARDVQRAAVSNKMK